MIKKFIDFKDLKVTDKGPGYIEGHRAVFSVDEGGDLILPGAFKDSLPDYLSSGFSAESHDWSFSSSIGFPVEAREDERGLWVKSQFHSTPDAQAIRIKAKERMDAGKRVGFSFGYSPLEFEYIDSANYEKELPRYVMSDLSYNLRQAKKFNRVRLLKRVEIIEDSIVTAPMNRQAAATSVKGSRHGATAGVYSRGRSLQMHLHALEVIYGPYTRTLSSTDALKLRIEALKLHNDCAKALCGPARFNDNERLRIESVKRSANLIASLAGL